MSSTPSNSIDGKPVHPSAIYVYKMILELALEMKSRGRLKANKHEKNLAAWTSKVTEEEQKERRKHILEILPIAKTIFRSEQRVVRVASPAYVFGDIHGNLSDLMHYYELFWSLPLEMLTGNFVFLGDYVDRGNQSLEVFLFLLMLKILKPDNFIILRGNHETAEMHKCFNFRDECLQKLGSNHGNHIWNLMNDVMDVMPFSAVIANSVFCAHGGIPKSMTSIAELNTIETDLSDPENEAPAAWEILWNDPASKKDLEKARHIIGRHTARAQRTEEELKEGFLDNMKRGTAYAFSEVAVHHFLEVNGLSHVIRAHEVVPLGFKVDFGGKVVTVFSSSYYEGGQNKSGCILVQDAHLTPIQIQTLDKHHKVKKD